MKTRKGFPGIILSMLLIAAYTALGALVYRLNLLPVKEGHLLTGAALVLVVVTAVLLSNRHHKVRFCLGLVLWLVLMGAACAGGTYLYKTQRTLAILTEAKPEVAQVAVYVRSQDRAASLKDTKGYVYGVLSGPDEDTTEAALAQVRETLGEDMQLSSYPGIAELVDALTEEEVDAILLNTAFLALAEELDGNEDLSERLRAVAVERVETAGGEEEEKDFLLDGSDEMISKEDSKAEVSVSPQVTEGEATKAPSGKPEQKTEATPSPKPTLTAAPEKKTVEDETLVVYISGIDNRGGIIEKSRSDTNILVAANLKTHEAVMISTPRDYWVPLSISNGVRDKLTHAGIYGVQVSMDTLGMLYDLEIKDYVKVNFSGFVKIIDALGGITVYSDYTFDSKNELGWHYDQGENTLDGEAALTFARERFSFSEGDRQRGRNQMAIIQGVLDKVMSREVLNHFSDLLDSLTGAFETNISYTRITEIIKSQMNSFNDWHLVTYSVDGTSSSEKTYSLSSLSSVMIPDEDTVRQAKALIRQVLAGEVPESSTETMN